MCNIVNILILIFNFKDIFYFIWFIVVLFRHIIIQKLLIRYVLLFFFLILVYKYLQNPVENFPPQWYSPVWLAASIQSGLEAHTSTCGFRLFRRRNGMRKKASVFAFLVHSLVQWVSTFLVLQLSNTVHQVAVTPNHNTVLLLLHSCIFATVRTHNVNVYDFWRS